MNNPGGLSSKAGGQPTRRRATNTHLPCSALLVEALHLGGPPLLRLQLQCGATDKGEQLSEDGRSLG